jgi:hypothetical protein
MFARFDSGMGCSSGTIRESDRLASLAGVVLCIFPVIEHISALCSRQTRMSNPSAVRFCTSVCWNRGGWALRVRGHSARDRRTADPIRRDSDAGPDRLVMPCAERGQARGVFHELGGLLEQAEVREHEEQTELGVGDGL